MKTRSHQLFQVFLDTEFFISNNFQFKFQKFKKIIELVKTNKISLYSTKITNLEIQANIEKEVKGTLEYFKVKNQKDYKLLRNFDRFSNLFERFNVELLTQELLNEYINFYRESNTKLIDINNVSVESVFLRYFEKRPPFSEGKKHEFPDAFVLEALEKWCLDNKEQIFVISNDSDIKNYCEKSEKLVLLRKIDELLEKILLADETEEKGYFYYQAFNKNTDRIEKQIKDELSKDLDYLDYEYGTSIDLESFKITGKSLISIEKEQNDNLDRLTFNVFVQLNFPQTMDVPQDWDEHEGYGYATEWAEETYTITIATRVEVKLSVLLNDLENVKIEAVLPEIEEESGRKFLIHTTVSITPT